MPSRVERTYSRTSIEAARLLGRLIRLARKERRMPAQELAERLGASRSTVQRMEKGDLKVESGLFFEAAAILGVPLFTRSEAELARIRRSVDEKIALLPEPPRRKAGGLHDDF